LSKVPALGKSETCVDSRLRDGPLTLGLQTLEIACEELLLFLPVTAEAHSVRAEREIVTVDIAGRGDDLSPCFDGFILVSDCLVEGLEGSGLLLQVVGDAGEQSLQW
jgi:hypothetical protein